MAGSFPPLGSPVFTRDADGRYTATFDDIGLTLWEPKGGRDGWVHGVRGSRNVNVVMSVPASRRDPVLYPSPAIMVQAWIFPGSIAPWDATLVAKTYEVVQQVSADHFVVRVNYEKAVLHPEETRWKLVSMRTGTQSVPFRFSLPKDPVFPTIDPFVTFGVDDHIEPPGFGGRKQIGSFVYTPCGSAQSGEIFTAKGWEFDSEGCPREKTWNLVRTPARTSQPESIEINFAVITVSRIRRFLNSTDMWFANRNTNRVNSVTFLGAERGHVKLTGADVREVALELPDGQSQQIPGIGFEWAFELSWRDLIPWQPLQLTHVFVHEGSEMTVMKDGFPVVENFRNGFAQDMQVLFSYFGGPLFFG